MVGRRGGKKMNGHQHEYFIIHSPGTRRSKLREQHGRGTEEGEETCQVGRGEQHRWVCMALHVTRFEPSLSSRCPCYWSSFLHLPGEYLLVLLLPIPSSTLHALSCLGSMNSPYLKSLSDCGRCFWGHHHIHSPHLLFLGSCARGFHAHD